MAANTPACFYELIGHRIIGLLFDALPAQRLDIARGTKTLILDDGTGLTIAGNGSYWRETAEAVQAAVQRKALELEATAKALAEVLAIAGQGERDR